MVATKNLEVFNKGIKAVQEKILRQLTRRFEDMVEHLIDEAIIAYQSSGKDVSLTGNLINSIAGAFYHKGKPVFAKYATSSEEARSITSTYTFAGDRRGFYDYDTGEFVPFVKQYAGGDKKFQRIPYGGTGLDSAMDFFGEYEPKHTYEVVIVAAAPYAEFLQKKRDLDVLTTAKVIGDARFTTLVHSSDTYKL